MAIEVKWMGFDFGQCLMDTRGLRSHLVIGDVCKELGEPELIDERIHKYHILKEKYENYSVLKEGHRDQIIEYVFDNNFNAQELFVEKEQEHLIAGKGLEETLRYLTDQGIKLSVVSELKKTLGPVDTNVISRFLTRKGLMKYFKYILSPLGLVDVNTGFVYLLKYKDKTKEEGTIYDELVQDLRIRGVDVSEAVMVGDKLWTDIIPAKKRGLITIQYTGYIDMGPCEYADFRISDFREIKDFVKGKL
jgi:FMN phosphatase YigB (HAD superfamily)